MTTLDVLRPLPYASWKATKTTLHLWSQIVGKVRLGHTAHRNHWWNVTLLPTPRGLSTSRMQAAETAFELEFDFIEHQLLLRSNVAAQLSFALEDGLSVAAFYRNVEKLLAGIGVKLDIVAKPYGVPMTTPFAQDEENRSYDRAAVRAWFDIVLWTTGVFDEFASEFVGKESPTQLFWHGFDLAMGRFSGKPAANGPVRADLVQKEAYSHEVIAFGFWPGDDTTPAPSYYTYTAPEPPTLTEQPLRPSGAGWFPAGSGHMGGLPYDFVRESADPRATLLDFLHAGYSAGTTSAAWPEPSLASHFPNL